MESPYEDRRGLLRVPNPNPLMLCILETISISVFGTGSRDAGEANSLYIHRMFHALVGLRG